MCKERGTFHDDISYLRTNRLSLLRSGAYTPENIVTEEARPESELATLQEAKSASDLAMAELMKEITILSELIKNAIPVYNLAKPYEKEKIIRVIFSELYVAQDMLEYKVKKGFEPFSDHLSALCDRNVWLSELCEERECIKSSIKSLTLIQQKTHV